MTEDSHEPPSILQPIVFEHHIVVLDSDIDGLGHVNNVVYLRWVQDAAAAHWNHTATADERRDIAWVAIRHEIDYLRPAYLNDSLHARTFVGVVKGVKFERFVEIVRTTDADVVAKSRSVWVAIDASTGRPRRIDPSINTRFLEAVPTL